MCYISLFTLTVNSVAGTGASNSTLAFRISKLQIHTWLEPSLSQSPTLCALEKLPVELYHFNQISPVQQCELWAEEGKEWRVELLEILSQSQLKTSTDPKKQWSELLQGWYLPMSHYFEKGAHLQKFTTFSLSSWATWRSCHINELLVLLWLTNSSIRKCTNIICTQ